MDMSSITGFLTGNNIDATTIAALFILFAVLIIIGIACYIYISLAFMTIAKRLKQSNPGLAWIPGVGPLIIAYKASKMDPKPWWALLFGAVLMLIGIGIMAFSGTATVGIIIGVIILVTAVLALLYYSVYSYIWNWKLFEALSRPGWWGLITLFGLPLSLLGLIPLIGIIFSVISYGISLWYFVMVGVAAWGKQEVSAPKKIMKKAVKKTA